MAKRIMDKIKQFRGDKQAVRAATNAWMAGNVGSVQTRSTNGGKRSPPFQVEAINDLTNQTNTKKARKAKPKKTKPATAVTATRAITLPVPPVASLAPYTPTAPYIPTTKKHASAKGHPVTQEAECLSDDGSGTDDDNEREENLLSDGSDVEEEDAQLMTAVQAIVTPRRQEQAQLPVEEEEMTVQQYQIVLADYQDRLLRAERQVRAISKTHLADKFMENEVRKYVKESLWKRCKFITSAETMEHCMNEVANHFAVAAEKREHWKSTYAHSVRDALNNRRNNTAQDLKKELVGKCNALRQWCMLCNIQCGL
jgi:predicted transposase YbfD/YdcC